MQASGLPIPPEYVQQVHGGEPHLGLAAAPIFLALASRPTALVCFNDMLAVGVLQGLAHAGVRVPQEISVAGFDNIVFSAYTHPPLTTFDQPKRFIGIEAARLLLGLLGSPAGSSAELEPRLRMLRGSLLPRQSTAAPPLSMPEDHPN
jgi:DNA-binding LacI/PurR family transcriptional regulator